MRATVTEKSYSEYTKEEVAATLRASGASLGWGSEVLVIEVNDEDDSFRGIPLQYGRRTGTATQSKGLQRSFSDIGDE